VIVGRIGDFDWRRGVLKDRFYGRSAPRDASKAVDVGMAGACCLFIPRAVFETIGVFDDNFFLYYEDTDRHTRGGGQSMT
jgi:GT2 family glycosyltransferase